MTIRQIQIRLCDLWADFRNAKADGDIDGMDEIRDEIKEMKNKLAYLQKKANLADYLA